MLLFKDGSALYNLHIVYPAASSMSETVSEISCYFGISPADGSIQLPTKYFPSAPKVVPHDWEIWTMDIALFFLFFLHYYSRHSDAIVSHISSSKKALEAVASKKKKKAAFAPFSHVQKGIKEQLHSGLLWKTL